MTGRCRLYRIERVLVGEGTIVGWRETAIPYRWTPQTITGRCPSWPIVLIDGEEIEARPGTYEWSALPDPLSPIREGGQ